MRMDQTAANQVVRLEIDVGEFTKNNQVQI